MLDRAGAAFLAALKNLNELSERLAVGRDDDDYLRRLANAAQNTAIAAREVYAETCENISCAAGNIFRGQRRKQLWPLINQGRLVTICRTATN